MGPEATSCPSWDSPTAASGTISSFDLSTGNYLVVRQLEMDREPSSVCVSPAALVPSRLWKMPTGITSGIAGIGVESRCGFVDRTGRLHHFWLHLPSTFGEQRVWPMLLFLHGSGGGTLLYRGKKWNNHASAGALFAAAH